MNDTTGRILRSILQLVAGGGLAGIVAALADGLDPAAAAVISLAGTLAVTIAQNLLEDHEVIPTILKPAGSPVPVEVVEPPEA